jgi:hypothetical protein
LYIRQTHENSLELASAKVKRSIIPETPLKMKRRPPNLFCGGVILFLGGAFATGNTLILQRHFKEDGIMEATNEHK